MECKYDKAKKALEIKYEEYIEYYKDSIRNGDSDDWMTESERRILFLEELLYDLFELNKTGV